MENKNFGYFDDKNREFVITNPATPFPWINYLGNTIVLYSLSDEGALLLVLLELQNEKIESIK